MTRKTDYSLRGDIFGGLTAAVVALPLAIAFGVAAFAPMGVEYASTGALVGLLGAIFTGLFAAWFGGTPAQVTGPTGPMTVVSTAVIAAVVKAHGGDFSTVMLLLALAVVIGGLFQILVGVIGAGKVVRYIPYPVVAGFMNGIAIILFLSQVKPFFGISGEWSSFSLDTAMVPMIVGSVTVATIVIADRVSKAVPGSLVGLVMGILTYLGLAASGFAPFTSAENPLLVGMVPNPFGSWEQMQTLMPVFQFSSLVNITGADIQQAIAGGLALGVLGSIDSLLTSVVADTVTQGRHDSRQELIGQGIGNIVSGLGGGLAGAGATVRTLVNINAGGRTKRSGMLHSIVLITAVIALGAPAGWIPLSALAGILFVTAVTMVDYYSLELLKRRKVWREVAVIATVTAVTVSVDLMVAVAVGCGIALLLFVVKQVKLPVIRRRLRGNEVFSRRVRSPEEMEVLRQQGSRTLVYELNGALFFGTADAFSAEVESDIAEADRFIFDFTKVTDVDLSGVQILLNTVERLRKNKSVVGLSSLARMEKRDPNVHEVLFELKVIETIGGENIYPSLDRALEAMEEKILNRHDLETGTRELLPMKIADNQVFSQLVASEAQGLGQLLEHRYLAPGEWLFRPGEVSDKLALVHTGRLSIVRETGKGETRLASLGAGAIVGLRMLFDKGRVHSSIHAEEPTEVYLVSKESLTHLAEHNPAAFAGLFREMLQSAMQRLDLLTTELALLEGH